MSRPRHAFLSSFLATCAVAFLTAVPHSLEAASSYFMVQGPLGGGGAYETYKFRVEYTGVLSIPGFSASEQNSGHTMLAALFGTGTYQASGTYSNSLGTVKIPSSFMNSFQMAGGPEVGAGIYPTGPQWGYFVAGGSYVNEFPGMPTTSGDYDSSAWTSSYTGVNGRYLEDGSIDAWSHAVMTDTGIDDDWGDVMIFTPPVGVLPTLADFSGSGYTETKVSANGLSYSVYLITAVPEPGRMLLCLLGVTAVIARRSRRTRF
jgi:hypothetical protein